MPRGEAVVTQETWNSGSATDVVIQPSSDEADFVSYIKLLISDDFAMTSGDSIDIDIAAYGGTQSLSVTSAGVVADDIAGLIALGDAEMFEMLTIGAVNYYKVVIKFKPPVYLRNSTSPAESITLSYDDSGGGITAGQIIIATEHWTITEDDSGL
jgi:hypothetical protein